MMTPPDPMKFDVFFNVRLRATGQIHADDLTDAFRQLTVAEKMIREVLVCAGDQLRFEDGDIYVHEVEFDAIRPVEE